MEIISQNFLIFVTAIFVGAATGYLGSFMVLRKMALVGDAMSHVALPGLAIALAFGMNPFVGAFVSLALATIVIWFLEDKTSLSTEALVGILFTTSLAVGILITPDHELLEALFGDISRVGVSDAVMAVILSGIAILFAWMIRDKYLLGTISSDVAKTSGINVGRINLAYLILVSLIVALGIKIAGTLLTGALVVLPAASSKNIASNFKEYSIFSAVFGILSAFLGTYVSVAFSLPPGPMIVLVSASMFVVSLFGRNRTL